MSTISCYKVRFGNDTEKDPVGLLGAKAFLFPLFLDHWKYILFTLQDLPWVPKQLVQTVAIREGRGFRDKGGTVKRNNSATLGQGPGSPEEIYITISFFFFWKKSYFNNIVDTESEINQTSWRKALQASKNTWKSLISLHYLVII